MFQRISEKWSLRVLATLQMSPMHFLALQRSLIGVLTTPRVILTTIESRTFRTTPAMGTAGHRARLEPVPASELGNQRTVVSFNRRHYGQHQPTEAQ